jgi:hypothetical protein
MAHDGDVGVEYGGAGDEDRTPRGKLQDELAVPENEMPALPVVKVPECSDCAPAKCEIAEVTMAECACAGSEIKGTGGEDPIEEGSFKVLVPLVKRPHVVHVKVEEIWCPVSKEP